MPIEIVRHYKLTVGRVRRLGSGHMLIDFKPAAASQSTYQRTAEYYGARDRHARNGFLETREGGSAPSESLRGFRIPEEKIQNPDMLKNGKDKPVDYIVRRMPQGNVTIEISIDGTTVYDEMSGYADTHEEPSSPSPFKGSDFRGPTFG